jgi:hypothetical protein
MEHGKLKSQGGQVQRTATETARLLAVQCGVEVTDAGYGLRTTGIDRSNRDKQLPRIEKRWPQ